jgi:transcriptional regulator with XRE-family HTH domain
MSEADNSIDWQGLSDLSIVNKLGELLRQIRLDQNLTQEMLARKAGLSRSAISEMENGKAATSLITVVQVLRAMQKLYVFNSWQAEPEENSSVIAKTKNKVRLRADRRQIQLKKEENEWEWL